MVKDIIVKTGHTELQRGCVLQDDIIMGRAYGPEDAPVIIVLGGISATRFVADGGRLGRGWWSTLVRDGGPIDLNKFRIIGIDFAPNVGAKTCPESITTFDQAARLKALLDHLNVSQARAIIGSSYGGMTALAFAQTYPDRVANLLIIGAGHKPYPIGVGWRGIQRRIVRLGIKAGLPKDGLKLARELAMTTYRTPEEFSDRFDLIETAQNPSLFDICDYLGSRGDAFAEQMNADRFLALSESIDLHRVEPELISTPTLLMSAISDQLAPLSEMRELRDRLNGPSALFTFTSLFGHDAFLKEYDAMSPRIEQFCQEIFCQEVSS